MLHVTDPQYTPEPARNAVEQWFAERLRDPRDLHFVRQAAILSAWVVIPAIGFYSGVLPAWTGLLWVPFLFVTLVGRYTLMLHAVSHRKVFRRGHPWLQAYIPWVLGPFFGQTPNSFFVHHVGMHHPENNGEYDLSSTMAYRRDRPVDFLHYWARFFFTATFHLPRYLWVRRRKKLFWKLLRGEIAWYTAMAMLLVLAPLPTLIVFVVPYLLIRWFMMSGNFAQHAFVDVDEPLNCYRNSTCLINTRYNHDCYNDGYHIVHHVKPNLHWTEMATWFLDHLDEMGREDAIVFDGLGNNQVLWWCIMTGQWDRLANHLVDLPGAPERTHAEKVALLQQRARRKVGEPGQLLRFDPVPPRWKKSA